MSRPRRPAKSPDPDRSQPPTRARGGRSRRGPLFLLLALDVVLAIALYRLPVRVLVPPPLDHVPDVAPGFVAASSRGAFFVLTPPRFNAETVLVTVPFDPANAHPTRRVLDRDLAMLEPVRNLDAFIPTGARWAWNGSVLLLASPARGVGANRIAVALIGPGGLILPPRTLDGSRPSCGWARDHFEVAYVTPAPPPDAGRVQWIVDIDPRGGASNERIVSQPGTALDPFAWPDGVRTHVEGVTPGDIAMPDGTRRPVPRRAGVLHHPVFDLRPNARADLRFVQVSREQGSAVTGDSTFRLVSGDVIVTVRGGTQVAHPTFDIERRGRRARIETDLDARARDLVTFERGEVLHLVDPRGFHLRLRASDLSPLDPRLSRWRFLAGALGAVSLALVVAGLVLAHLLAWVVERAAQGRRPFERFATVAWLVMALCAGAADLLVWTAR